MLIQKYSFMLIYLLAERARWCSEKESLFIYGFSFAVSIIFVYLKYKTATETISYTEVIASVLFVAGNLLLVFLNNSYLHEKAEINFVINGLWFLFILPFYFPFYTKIK